MSTCVFQENVSLVCEYLAYSDPTRMLFKWLIIINANLCVVESSIGGMNINRESIRMNFKIRTLMEKLDFVFWEQFKLCDSNTILAGHP